MSFKGSPHVIEAQQFSREWLEGVFLPLTDEMEVVFRNGGSNILRGKRMVLFFYQSSTRTNMSFQMAMSYLGGTVAFSTDNAREFSSARKGETFSDTIKVICRYRPDVIVIRYDFELAAKFAAEISTVPIINAGDREPGQHPTQALLDLRTIRKRRGQIDGLRIAMVGDLRFGRTVRSLSYLLGKYDGVEIDFVSPPTMAMGDDVKEYLNRHNVRFRELNDLRQVAPYVDAVYQTRTQNECGAELDRKDHNLGYFTVDADIADSMKEDAMILHPLPRVEEITTDVDSNPRAAYLTDQLDSGLFVRMALLQLILTA